MSKTDRTQHATETAQCRSPIPSINAVGRVQSDIHMFSNLPEIITRSWTITTLKQQTFWSVVSHSLWLQTCGMVSTSCLFPSGGMLCLAPSCHAPSNHIPVIIRMADLNESNSILEPYHINLKRTRAQSLLVTPLCEVTCVATTSPCPEQAKLKRQNRCLESVCK